MTPDIVPASNRRDNEMTMACASAKTGQAVGTLGVSALSGDTPRTVLTRYFFFFFTTSDDAVTSTPAGA